MKIHKIVSDCNVSVSSDGNKKMVVFGNHRLN